MKTSLIIIVKTLLILSVVVSVMSSSSEYNHFEYLYPKAVKDHGAQKCGGSATIKVTVYKGLTRDVCPNPHNEEKVSHAENQYNSGCLVGRSTYYLTKEQFENPEFWNS